MFNVTVLKIGDIIKYLVGISIIVMLMVFTARYFSSTKENKNTKNFKILQANSLTKCMEQEIPAMASISSENDIKEQNTISQNNYLEQFLQTNLSLYSTKSSVVPQKIQFGSYFFNMIEESFT